MKFFRYWAASTAEVANRDFTVRCHGGSNSSVDEAKRNAEDVARRAASAIAAGSTRAEYGYFDRPPREEVIEEHPSAADPVAVITRNSYGSLVLNTDRVLFADVDYLPQGCLASLFSFGKRTEEDRAVIERVSVIAESSGISLRLYRTAAGFRVVATSREFDPLSNETEELLSMLGSDKLYVRLCRLQESFRARVTPKPWRCEIEPPPARIPWDNDEQEQAYRQWETAYEEDCLGYSTCAEIGSFGVAEVHPTVEMVLRVHDQYACRGDRPLA